MKIISFMLVISLIVIACSAEYIYASPNNPSGNAVEDPFKVSVLGPDFKRLILGTARVDKLEIYAIVKETGSGRRFLYNKGDWLDNDLEIIDVFERFLVLKDAESKRYIDIVKGIPYRGFEFVRLVKLKEFSYSYLLVDEEQSEESTMFELESVKGYRAKLEKKYKDRPKKISEEELPEPSLDERFFFQLKTKKVSDNTWIVDSQSVETPIVNSTQEAFVSAAEKVSSVGFGRNGLKIGFSSNVCSGALDKEGFSVDELSPQVMEKAGLCRGDIIKTVNGKKVFNIIDLMFLFLDIRNGSTSEIDVEVLRTNERLTLKYIID